MPRPMFKNKAEFFDNISCEECASREVLTYSDLAGHTRFYCIECLGTTDGGKPKFGAIPLSEALKQIGIEA